MMLLAAIIHLQRLFRAEDKDMSRSLVFVRRKRKLQVFTVRLYGSMTSRLTCRLICSIGADGRRKIIVNEYCALKSWIISHPDHEVHWTQVNIRQLNVATDKYTDRNASSDRFGCIIMLCCD